jgi:glycosyltransferase involved in cell wall biosynthesis
MFPNKNNNVFVLIPAYNEERSIAVVVRKALQYLPVLVVDDGSHDGTVSAASQAGAAVISHQKNEGKGASLMTGFTQALQQGSDFVITLDADGQHDPQEIPAFLQAYAHRRPI